ncbi:MAG: DUF1800 domain-containing protein [Planctomycetaceae bacterium]|nr:DUF1800 domain-containing protein [Planctomycetaceae bacterium]
MNVAMSSMRDSPWYDRWDPSDAWSVWEPSAADRWDFMKVAHLHRRAGFAAPWDAVEQDANRSHTDVIGSLLSPARTEATQQTFEADKNTGQILATGGNSRQLAAWWLLRMVHAPEAALERLTLFWHGHFATSADKVAETNLMWRQYLSLRKLACGPFRDLVQEISRDPAMLIYLDARDSRKAKPNENFAREVLELFCLGTGNYTEQDIRELARAFTGGGIRHGKFFENKYQFDEGEKSFLNYRGPANREQAIDAIVDHAACAQFIVWKLVRQYVADDVPRDHPLIRHLAQTYRDSHMTTSVLLNKIWSSRLFFTDECRGARVQGPVEWCVGLLRTLRISFPMEGLAEELRLLGQLPLYPPSVKGWDGGLQWIDVRTAILRSNLAHRLVREGRMAEGSPVPSWARKDWGGVVRELAQLLCAQAIPEPILDSLTKLAEQTNEDDQRRLAILLGSMATLPEFQVC